MILHRPQNPSEPDIRYELVERVRRQLDAGVYDTPEKFEAAFWRMVKDVGLEDEFSLER
jgi:hypothetical protein